MKRTRLLLLSVLFFTKAFGQHTVVFKYDIHKDSSFSTSDKSIGTYFFKIKKNLWDKFDPTSEKDIMISRKFYLKNPKEEIETVSYNFGNPGTYFIQDIYGHEILFDPTILKDTVRVSLMQNHLRRLDVAGNKSLYLNDSIPSSTIFNTFYSTDYKYIGFFDTLKYLHGSIQEMQPHHSFKELNHNLDKYLSGVTEVYSDRMAFFKKFIDKHGIPHQLQLVARKEIQYSYYNDLLDPLIEWNVQTYAIYPKALQDTIENFRYDLNNTNLFESTSLFRRVLTEYISLMNSNQEKGPLTNYNSTSMNKILDYTQKNLSGKIQTFEMAWLMQVSVEHGDTTLENIIYHHYQPNPECPSINKLMDSIYFLGKHPGLPPKEMRQLTFENSSHSEQILGNISTKKLIVIDCWATWCIPCRNEIPFMNTIAKKYSDRVQFIALSADQDLKKWDTWMTMVNNNKNETLQLHAKGGFENIFFKKFMIYAIPRYILLSNSGEILDLNMPYPSEHIAFEEELAKYL